jgi:hypothetical protein
MAPTTVAAVDAVGDETPSAAVSTGVTLRRATQSTAGQPSRVGDFGPPAVSRSFAQQSSNTSAENETNLTVAEVAMLWSMDRDKESDQWAPFASDPPTYLTEYQGIYASTDAQYRRPPEHATEWNRWTTSQFEAGGTDVSVHPPNSSLQQGNIIKDAYIEIAAITPSTEVRYEEGSRELLAHPEGEIQVVVDYRVRPDTNLNPRKRVRYSVDSHNIEHVAMANDFGGEDGDTYLVEQVDDPGHAATIDYDVAGGGSRDVVVRAQIAAEITKTVQEAEPTCEGNGSVEDCASSITYEWENSSTETVTESLTVYDRRENVDIYYASITADQAYARPHSEGGVEYRYENLPQYWSTLTLPDGNTIYGPYTYYTRRRPRRRSATSSSKPSTAAVGYHDGEYDWEWSSR